MTCLMTSVRKVFKHLITISGKAKTKKSNDIKLKSTKKLLAVRREY